MEHPIARLEAIIIKHLLDSEDFPVTDMRGMFTDMKDIKTATTAVKMIISKRATVRMGTDKKVMAINNKVTGGTNTVMQDTAVIILTLGLLLSSTSRRESLYILLLSFVAHS